MNPSQLEYLGFLDCHGIQEDKLTFFFKGEIIVISVTKVLKNKWRDRA